MNPVKSIRARYIVGLSALALVLAGTYLLVERTIERQQNYGRVINIAGNQVGLANRIAFFVGQMESSLSEEDYVTAREQVGRAVSLMRTEHQALINGDTARGIPRIMTPILETIYFGSNVSLDAAHKRFLRNADTVYKTEFGALTRNTASYVYVVTYGPFVLETLLNAAVTEYEAFSRQEIQALQRLELLALLVACLVLLIEAVFIFRPLELKVREAFRDIRNKRDELLLEKERAEQANYSKTEFLSKMSHELRTPLNAIVGFSECFKEGVYGPLASETQVERIELIHRSGVHLLDLVNDILDISLAETGDIALQISVVPMKELVSASVSFVTPLAKREGVALSIAAEDLPALELKVDMRRARQILINLLTNAVKFTPRGGSVCVATVRLSDGRAGFAVTDTGLGMTGDEIKIARERFGQVGDVQTRQHDGAGLGIPLVIELMACHGGVVEIESEKGKGTTVKVLFPADRVVGVSSAQPVAA